jgi:NADP-dependent 3-hydroxy acid dehydrogenase YdfG
MTDTTIHHQTAIDHRVAIVTGASSGIGQAIARTLASTGYRIVAVARRQQGLDALAQESPSRSGRITPLAADVTTPGAAASIIDRTLTEHGRLDVLVNAAGYGINAPSESMSEKAWDDLFAVNLNAVAHLTAAALPSLLHAAAERGIADVVTIASTAGLSAEPAAAAYSASKFAARGLMEAWRKEYADRDVRFCTVNPGAVATEFGGDQQFIRDWYADMHRRGAVALPDDVAQTVAFALALPPRASLSEITLRPTRQV